MYFSAFALNTAPSEADKTDMGRGRLPRALIAALLVVPLGVAAGTGAAGASDLQSLRERAQAVADQVSGMERRLGSLEEKQESLVEEIEASSADIGLLEQQVQEAEAAYQAAMDEYVARAVELYKGGTSTQLAILLSSATMDDLFTALEAANYSAGKDERALEELIAARASAEASQREVDRRKQSLLVANERVEALAGEIGSTIETRRELLGELMAEIDDIEQAARRAAADAARPDQAFLDMLQPSGPAPGIPDGYVGTGVTFEGIASWYGPGFEGNPTANGDIFDPNLFTVASKELPFGTWLYVTYRGRGVVVLVNDRGPYVGDRILDLSQAAAEALGIGGLGWVEAEILLKARSSR